MKIQILRAILVFGFVTGMASFAEAQGAERYRAHIPFDFSIGKKHFDAGEYFVEVRGMDSRIIVIREANGKNSYSTVATSAEIISKGRQARLDFRQLDGRHVLELIKVSSLAANMSRPTENRKRATVTTVALSKRK